MGERGEELRALERQWLVSGDVEDQSKWLGARVRLGDLALERLQQAAYLGHPGALGAGLGSWEPPEREGEGESTPAERVLAEGGLPASLLRRAAGEAAARAVESCEIDRRATPRECVRVALGLREAEEDELADLLERSEELVAEERGGLSLLLGIALLDQEKALAVEETARKNTRSALAAGASAACLRTAIGGEGAAAAAAEALSEAASSVEDPVAERAWQHEFLSKLLLDQAPLVRSFEPPSQEARDYEELLEGNFEGCTCGEPEAGEGAPEDLPSPEEERRQERNTTLVLCGLAAIWILVSDAAEGKRVLGLACLGGLAGLQVVAPRVLNVLCLISGLFFVLNAFVDWGGWPLWGRALSALAGLWWIRSSWLDIQRDAPSDAWGTDASS